MENKKSFGGSCLCRAVRFEIEEFLPRAGHCHCTMCRKFHGASFSTYAGVKTDKFHWVSGEDKVKTYTADNETVRTFCSHCGASLLFSSPNLPADVIEVALGVMDDDIPVEPVAHIHFGSRANWTVAADDLPKYEAG